MITMMKHCDGIYDAFDLVSRPEATFQKGGMCPRDGHQAPETPGTRCQTLGIPASLLGLQARTQVSDRYYHAKAVSGRQPLGWLLLLSKLQSEA